MREVKKQSGFSLIEALVAFMILSVGMLGVASLQTISLKSGHTALLRTVAVMKVDEILENMRANNTAILNYAAGTGDAGTDHGCSEAGTAAVKCTPAQMASDDVFRWKRGLKEVLPNNAGTTASIQVTVPVAPETLHTVVVTVNWSERDIETGNAASMSHSVAVQM